MLKFTDIAPNNLDQAMAYVRQCVADGTWSPDKAESLLRMQDNPDAVIDAIIAESGGRPARG